ncbi:DEAD/DEAH box helicase [Virgibacillus sp. MSJ-26]|uniref:DEAD/DEAH box helicase n=1 Tax=Virgibacillus sp. MSJ-26 TaxID=2841522 RepID=UPI001C121D7C|nr:SNF2-related protein [Virgibacillus sp. MSJ-26]MBU5466382.1 DEAD/DEAH box helicase [Virgibacillus sp. MSJ-26]
MKNIKLETDKQFIKELDEKVNREETFSSWDLFSMAYQTELTNISPNFGELHALNYLSHIDFLPHQVETAKQAIQDMNGRAILADEVGLGKTIEAGLILKEYLLRGLVKKILILVPASLVNQWARELNEKFFIPAVPYRKNYQWSQHDILISSIDTAKRSPHREEILDIDYDLILIDEAHKLKNHQTQNYKLVRALKKKYCLLLTATPIQNHLIEIFNLVSILKPGHLGSYDSFIKEYGNDRNKIKQNAMLRKLIQKVMVRNTRKNTSLNQTSRKIETVRVDFSKIENDFYQQLSTSIQPLSTFAKITLLREICSSREACYLSLQKMSKEQETKELIDPLLKEIEGLPHHSKAKKVIELIEHHKDEKVIIFTEYRATQLYLQWYLQQHNITSVPFRGGFKGGKKDWMKQLFKNHAQVLIATEAGGEGINLQFCNIMINYDLPWNPMRLEQRIGRIHRYGQEKDVYIYNFAIKGTVEDHIMSLLYEKINLFQQVIGQLDDILAELDINNLESELYSIYTSSSSHGEAKIKLDNLASIIQNKNNELHNEEQSYGYN